MSAVEAFTFSVEPFDATTFFNWLRLTASVSSVPSATPLICTPPTEILPGTGVATPFTSFVVDSFTVIVVPPLEIVNGLVPLPVMELMPVKSLAN